MAACRTRGREGARQHVAVASDHGREASGEHNGEESHSLFVYDATLHVPLDAARANGLARGSPPGERRWDSRRPGGDAAGASRWSGAFAARTRPHGHAAASGPALRRDARAAAGLRMERPAGVARQPLQAGRAPRRTLRRRRGSGRDARPGAERSPAHAPRWTPRSGRRWPRWGSARRPSSRFRRPRSACARWATRRARGNRLRRRSQGPRRGRAAAIARPRARSPTRGGGGARTGDRRARSAEPARELPAGRRAPALGAARPRAAVLPAREPTRARARP